MPNTLPFRPALAAAVAAASLLVACGSDSGQAVEEPQVTGIALGPEDFLGAVPCLDAPGAMRLYQASLLKVENPPPKPGVPEEPLPTTPQRSGLIGCERGVAFGNVQIGAGYVASIVAFDQADVVEVGSDPPAYQDAAGNPVTPRWFGECERIDAHFEALRHAPNCKLSDERPSETNVLLVLDEATTGQSCDDIARYDVTLEGETTSAACGETVTFSGVDPTQPLELALLAFAGEDETPSVGGVCFARPAPGATITATCGPLQASGGLELRLATLAAALGASCGELRKLTVTLDEDPATAIEVTRPDAGCAGSIRWSSIEPGEHTVTVGGERAGEAVTASCSAEVQPGLVALPSCEPG